MMQQYREAKERHPGMLLLFRMGDFYELFDDDAEVAARVLGLTLTSRDKTIPMAGFPHHALERYLRKLLQPGHRVAICDQVEDPPWPRAWSTARSPASSRPAPSPRTTCSTRGRPTTWPPSAPRGGRAGRPGLGGAVHRPFQAADVPWQRLADELGRLAPPSACAPRATPTGCRPAAPARRRHDR